MIGTAKARRISYLKHVLRSLSVGLAIAPLLVIAQSSSNEYLQQAAFSQLPGQLPQPVSSPDIQVFEAYKSWLRAKVAEDQIPGVALAIVSSNGILDVETLGVRSVDDQQAVSDVTVFRIASVSKTFAGTVASQLVNHNILGWDEPISQVLPGYTLGTDAAGADRMTLRHVLSHTTGLMPHAFSNLLDAGVAYDKIQEKLHEIPAVCEPGRCYGYQNVVFSLVADVVEVSLGTHYDDFVEENIFSPLGMDNASMGLDGYENNPNASQAHQFGRGRWQVSSLNPAYYTVGPASGVNATILDMGRWAQAQLGGFPDVLPKTLLDMQHTPIVETPHGNYFNRWPRLDKAWYGLGWRVMDYSGLRVIHHGGGVRGYRSEMVLVPEHNVGLVVLFNASTPLANDVVPMFLDQLLTVVAP
ncbi:class A beta-lactamase-related serine hydrolase [Gammaproteobacteria bacterium LSUCC0112]|nr:class A beta-lactamase-related serine hydrolase [Gammaproteobacteria bacterium LSUCC0112]